MPAGRLGVALVVALAVALAMGAGCSRTSLFPVVLDGGGEGDDATEPVRDAQLEAPRDVNEAETFEVFEDSGGDAGLPSNVTLLASGQLYPQGLALSRTNVFWTNGGELDDAGLSVPMTGSIATTTRSPGGPTTTLASGLDEPLAIAYEETGQRVAFSVAGANVGTGSVMELEYSTGLLFPLEQGVANPYGIALTASDAYWVSNFGSTAQVEGSPLGPKDSGAPLTLGLASGYTDPEGMAIQSGSILFAALNPSGGGALLQLGITGGTPAPIWSTPTGRPFGVAVDANNVYWVDEGAGAVYQMPLGADAGAPVITLAHDLGHPFFVAVDSLSVYFATNVAGGAVYETGIGGSEVIALASGLPYPAVVAADDNDDYVYFTLESGIARVQKQ
jgi:hypothetical protein